MAQEERGDEAGSRRPEQESQRAAQGGGFGGDLDQQASFLHRVPDHTDHAILRIQDLTNGIADLKGLGKEAQKKGTALAGVATLAKVMG